MKHTKAMILTLGLLTWQGAQAQDFYPDSVEVSAISFDTPRKVKTTEHTLMANYLPGWITSKVATPRGEHTWGGGQGYEVGYRCLFSSGYGFGLSYAHSQTGYPGGYITDYELGLNYIGASFIYGGNINQHWITTVEIGLGYANYTDAGEKMKDGIGTKYGVGVEYMLGTSLGIGLGLSYQTSRFSKDEQFNSYYSDKYMNGFNRLAANIGLRLYL